MGELAGGGNWSDHGNDIVGIETRRYRGVDAGSNRPCVASTQRPLYDGFAGGGGDEMASAIRLADDRTIPTASTSRCPDESERDARAVLTMAAEASLFLSAVAAEHDTDAAATASSCSHQSGASDDAAILTYASEITCGGKRYMGTPGAAAYALAVNGAKD